MLLYSGGKNSCVSDSTQTMLGYTMNLLFSFSLENKQDMKRRLSVALTDGVLGSVSLFCFVNWT